MSSRKGGSTSKLAAPKQTTLKLSASKFSASKSSASKINMNASLMQPRSSSVSRNIRPDFNSTLRPFMAPPGVNASIVPSVDYELECDFAYNEYLQAMMMQELVRKGISKHRTDISDQLSINSKLLSTKREEANNLEEEINTYELKPRLQELMNVVNTTLCKTLEVLSPVEEKLDDLIVILEQAKNQLYLKNVKLFESEEESCNFVEMLGNCHTAIMKILNVTPQLGKCEQLTDALRCFKKVEEEIIRWDKSTTELQASTVNLTLEIVSDVLFNR